MNSIWKIINFKFRTHTYHSLPQYRISGYPAFQIVLNNQLSSSLTVGVNMLVIKKQTLQSLSKIVSCDLIKVQEWNKCFLKFLKENTKDEIDVRMMYVAGKL